MWPLRATLNSVIEVPKLLPKHLFPRLTLQSLLATGLSMVLSMLRRARGPKTLAQSVQIEHALPRLQTTLVHGAILRAIPQLLVFEWPLQLH